MGFFRRCDRDLAVKQYADGYCIEQIAEMQGVGVEAVRRALTDRCVDYDPRTIEAGFFTAWNAARWTITGAPEGAKEKNFEAYFISEWIRTTKFLLKHPETMYNVIERES